MTIDEAILHCEEKAQGCDECASEHQQLADWLRELKQRRAEQEPAKPAWLHGFVFCGECGKRITSRCKYCPNCGKAVLWSDK